MRWRYKPGTEVIVDVPIDINGISQKFADIIKLMVYENCTVWMEDHNERDGSGHDTGVQPEKIVEKTYYDVCKLFYDSNKGSLLRTLIYTIGHFAIAITVLMLIADVSFMIALTDAIVEPLANAVWYFVLDKIWTSKLNKKK